MRLLLAISRWTAEMIGRTQKIEKMHVRHEKLWKCGTSTRQVRSSSNLYHLLRSRSSIDYIFGWIFKKSYEELLWKNAEPDSRSLRYIGAFQPPRDGSARLCLNWSGCWLSFGNEFGSPVFTNNNQGTIKAIYYLPTQYLRISFSCVLNFNMI